MSEVKISILRANEAEVSVIGGFGGTIRGVDSVIAVTGCLGASAAGLEWLLRSRRAGGEEPQPSWAQELV